MIDILNAPVLLRRIESVSLTEAMPQLQNTIQDERLGETNNYSMSHTEELKTSITPSIKDSSELDLKYS